VNELIRWCGPVHLTQVRCPTEDVVLGGEIIRAGEAAHGVLASGNRDPESYIEPERLDITRRVDRKEEAHLGFGYGVHYCLGAALARLECEVALRTLFGRFPQIRLGSKPAEWAQVPGMRMLASLDVVLR
jgi:cytochrome P450